MGPVLAIQQVSRRSGVAASALRYYGEMGLIQAERARSDHRRSPRSVLRRIAFVVFAQRLGMSLTEIGEELSRLSTDHVPTGEDWSRLSARWTARIDQRMEELARLKAGLPECISCGCLSLTTCKLVNPQDAASRLGPTPRHWVTATEGVILAVATRSSLRQARDCGTGPQRGPLGTRHAHRRT